MAQVKFSFNAKRNEDGRWSYTYDHDAKKLSFDKMICTDSEIVFEAVLDTYDDKTYNTTKEDNYINELSLISSSNYNEEAVKDVFKKIHLESIDYSNTDKNGNITLYKFNKSVLPVYIRSGYTTEGKTDTYSYEEVEKLRNEYAEFIEKYDVNSDAINCFPEGIFSNMFITLVELVKNPVFKDHDVYYLYVSNKTMYEEITGKDLPEYGAFWELKHTRVTNYLTKERIDKCLSS